MSVSAVTLDAHGVLCCPTLQRFVVRWLRLTFIRTMTRVGESTSRWSISSIVMSSRTGTRSVSPWPQHLVSVLGQVDAAAPIVAEVYLNEPWIAAPGAKDGIVRLVSSDHSLAVVANSTHGQVEQWLADAGLCSIVGPLPKVACVLDSHVVGLAKPDRRIFEMALSNLGISADECLHVGDSVRYHAGPSRPLWLLRVGRSRPLDVA